MDDLISRQEAIDALNEYFARIGKLKRRGLTKGEKAISLDTVGAIKTLLPAQPEPRWIPVKKKPKAIGSYLCFEEGGFCYVDIWNGANWELIVKAYARPIAYMPLPKPYRKETEDDKSRMDK